MEHTYEYVLMQPTKYLLAVEFKQWSKIWNCQKGNKTFSLKNQKKKNKTIGEKRAVAYNYNNCWDES